MAKKKQNRQSKKLPQTPQSAASKAAQRAAAREERKRQKRKKIIRVTAIAAVSAVAVGALSYAVYRLVQESGVLMQTRIAAESDHYQVTSAMYCYFYDQCYDSYLSYFEDKPETIEFDTDKKLRDQKTSDGTTWHEFFVENANTVVQTMLQYCETAYDADFKLTDEQIADCAERAAKLDRSNMPAGVREEDMQKAMELELLAATYYNQFVDAISITDEDVAAYYEKHKAEYQTWDMLCYTFAYDDASANASNTVLKQEQAEQYANALAAVEGKEEFEEYVHDFLIDVKLKTEEDTKNLVKAMGLSANGSSYSDAVCDWVMEESPAVGDTFIYEEKGQNSYQVYMLTSQPVRNEADTVDFRTLVLFHSNHEGEAGALEQAEMLKDKWEESGADEAAFSQIAMTHTEDYATYQTGGLVEAYAADRTTYGTKVVDWLFDKSRKPGDLTIVSEPDVSKGVVVMAYFVQDNPKPVWENQVYSDMYDAELAVLEDEKKLQMVSFDDDNLMKLDF